MQKGLTVLELLIIIAILGILAAVGIPAYNDYVNNRGSQSLPVGYSISERCIGGYKHAVSRHSTNQILNSQGGGIACE